MQTLILIFLAALAVTGFSTPWVRQMALALGFVDAPSGRKLHATPMPLMGGVAIFGGAIVLLSVYFAAQGAWRVVGQLLGATLIALVGLLDDRRPLAPLPKFGGQMIAFGVAIAFGTRVQLPFPDGIDLVITFLWLAIITNAINFLDNMDGLCAGISAVAAAFIVLLATSSNQFLIAPTAAALLGACLGFLRYNFKPAQIFMGDAGSLLLGYMLAVMTLTLRFPENSLFVTWMVPVLILGLPLFDLTLVTIARLRRGVNPLTTGGKDHTSHRLVALGLSQREAVLTLYLIAGVFGMVALFVTRASLSEGYAIGAAVVVICLYYIVRLLRLSERAAAG